MRRFSQKELFLSGSSDRAGVGTGTAFDACIGIDYVFTVSLSDGGYRALRSTGAAADALIGNLVSHFFTSKSMRPHGSLITL